MLPLQEKKWWTIDDLAEYLSVKKNTVYSWISKDKIPYFRQGGLVRFLQRDIDGWMEAGKGASINRKTKKGDGNGNHVS